MATTIQNPRAQEVFAVIETTAGTRQAPVAGAFLVPAGYVDISQSPNFADSEEIIDSRDVTERFQGRWNPGEFTIPMYLRPSGSLGVAPDGDALFTSLMGAKTVNSGVSVVYSQTVDKSSFTLYRKIDDSLLWARGCVVTSMKPVVETGAGGAMVTFSGQFAELGWCGTALTSGAHTIADDVITLATGTAKRYKAGSLVEFVDTTETVYDNTTGYIIESVDYDADELTLTTGLEHGLTDGATCRPWLPTGTKVGTPLEMRKAYLVFDSVNKVLKGFSLDITDPISYIEEITEDAYPVEYAGTKRDINGTATKVLRQADLEDFYFGDTNTAADVSLIVGNVAGSICEINMPRTELEFPKLTNADPTVESAIGLKALATVGEDSLTITFR